MTSLASTDLGWLLDELVGRIPGVRSAVLLSTDGLLIARCRSLARTDAEHLCAMSSAMYGLARSAGGRFDGGGVRQAVIELEDAVLFVTAGGPNACLSVWAEASADMGMVAYEMNQTVQRVGSYLSATTRQNDGRVDSR
ncbi:roadblock/LC7 domain-containing protein [Nocardia asteroides]|uniref:roadblock/LC7 domain-containing protein n=1 Tax=Nocardia asteroides TaxID=1824 RepID=UPI001E2932CD|nr:roadblock/LC7 domain-containing protein [Nocardia asteroides]UGT61849.1 roadblock/LC7 domain-containing protein [Nocardia asteroides]